MGGIDIKNRSAKDNLKILGIFIVFIGVLVLGFLGVSTLLVSAIYTPWIASIIVLAAFLIVIWCMKERASWKQYGMIIICITAVVGCFFNTQGNPIFNLPIQWVYKDIGQLVILNKTTQIGSEYIIDYAFQIVDGNGAVIQTISFWAVLAFRFFEYVAIYSLLLTILSPVIIKIRKTAPEVMIATETEWEDWEGKQKQELQRRHRAEIDSRQINRDIEERIRTLMREGQTIAAIKLVRQHTSFSLGEAKELVDKYK